MKLLFITSKDESGCYPRIIQNWFQGGRHLIINNLKGNLTLDVVYKVSPEKDCCICIPPSINPDLPESLKTEIVVDELQKVLKELASEEGFMFKKEDVYLLIHSGDLFPLGDARRENGRISISAFPPVLQGGLKSIVLDEHIYQFRHDKNDITIALLRMKGDDVAELFEMITKKIEP